MNQADATATSASELSAMVSTAVSLSSQSALIAGISDSDGATYSAVGLLNSFIAADSSAALSDTSTSATETTATTSDDTTTAADTTSTSSISTYA